MSCCSWTLRSSSCRSSGLRSQVKRLCSFCSLLRRSGSLQATGQTEEQNHTWSDVSSSNISAGLSLKRDFPSVYHQNHLSSMFCFFFSICCFTVWTKYLQVMLKNSIQPLGLTSLKQSTSMHHCRSFVVFLTFYALLICKVLMHQIRSVLLLFWTEGLDCLCNSSFFLHLWAKHISPETHQNFPSPSTKWERILDIANDPAPQKRWHHSGRHHQRNEWG